MTSPGRTVGLLEAVRMTLALDPSIRLQEKQIDFTKGVLQNASGQFDLGLDTLLSRGITRTPRTQFERSYSLPPALPGQLTTVLDEIDSHVGLKKQFRSGISVGPALDMTRIADNLDQQRAVNRADINFAVTVPLLKGFGRKATGAAEEAARVDYEASSLDLKQTIATRILNTATAYWSCLAATKQLQILRESESRSSNLVEQVRALIRGKELPASDLKQVQADSAGKTAARFAGEQQLYQARQNLGLAIGLSLEQLPTAPLPLDMFPAAAPAPLMLHSPQVLQDSLERRADYQSLLKAQQSAEILQVAARKNLKPQLDLNVQVGYASLEEGSQFARYYGTLEARRLAGANALATLSLEWPFANNQARGLLLQRESLTEQTRIRLRDLARNISSGILVAVNNLEQSLAELEKAEVATQNYQLAVTNEWKKVQSGTSTIIDVITTADRYADAQINQISARSRYASALAQLRFETGTLVSPANAGGDSISLEDLITVPPVERLTPQNQKRDRVTPSRTSGIHPP
ncbi:MAG: TolC family protein [Limisphaerales bacterium]